ncbi:DNA polymerase III subunit beta [Deinococcus cellulosilyticus]|uniref:Beta sliding clamp n=1 Tax=Deinococcus cellulosilyticus (strain DSM 18568 / NBRC 106333 / KACC 11606 / 5516J-15) TaxID=1223518 RepID=A0A511N8A8_DEIC1|nr:DNA polymerase III subunit beta [Deinococcus cellulosilyticus]GEM48718.1 DNA polymerase III subunit beta [Deinococcus cellulosilyticus NBRC 106333 = KACC 11606]
MKVLVAKKFLNAALQKLARVVPPRNNNPILSYTRLTTTHQGFHLEGTNLELDLRFFVPAQVEGTAQLALPAHLFAQIVSKLPGETVEMSLQSGNVTVSSGGSNYKLQTGDVSQFPTIEILEGTAKVKGAGFKQALSNTLYCVANEAFQQVFRAQKVECTPERLRVVCSDGFRLAYFQVDGLDLTGNYLIPNKSAKEIAHLIDDQEGEITLAANTFRKQLSIHGNGWSLNTKLMDGEFPDYQRIVPSNIKATVNVRTSVLQEALNRTAVMCDSSLNNRIELQISDNKLHLWAENDYGKADEVLEVEHIGDPISLGFNVRFLSDAIKPITDEYTTLQLSGATTPAAIKGSQDTAYLSVVVPLRI